VVWDEELQRHDHRREEDREEELGNRDEEAGRRRHRAQIRADVEDVGDDGERHRRVEHRPPEAFPDERGQPSTRRQPEARGHLLHRGGHRSDRDRRPHQAETKRRADLRIGADAGRVVVGCAGDDPRAEAFEVAVSPKVSPPVMMRARHAEKLTRAVRGVLEAPGMLMAADHDVFVDRSG
jgi:hypothetical protein